LTDGTVESNALSNLKLFDLRGVKVKEANLQVTRGISNRNLQLIALWTTNDIATDDFAFTLLGFARNETGNRSDCRLVFVAQRQMQHEIPVARKPKSG
jgi:hypothetical protein